MIMGKKLFVFTRHSSQKISRSIDKNEERKKIFSLKIEINYLVSYALRYLAYLYLYNLCLWSVVARNLEYRDSL